MNININEKNFLPHCACSVELTLKKNILNLLIGSNGVGKSSLVKLIRNQHTKLVTLVEQAPIGHFYNRSLKELKRIIIQSNNENIDYHVFDVLWKDFKLNLIEENKLHSLSGGENQSLKLVLGLSSRRDLIILDEPSQYLDDSRKSILLNIVSELIKDKYVIMIEHDQSWIEGIETKRNKLLLNNNTLEVFVE